MSKWRPGSGLYSGGSRKFKGQVAIFKICLESSADMKQSHPIVRKQFF